LLLGLFQLLGKANSVDDSNASRFSRANHGTITGHYAVPPRVCNLINQTSKPCISILW
jgi:hypothetical protein